MKETSKSLRRRRIEHERGEFPWMDIFKGKILDIGAGSDPLPFPDVTVFDQEQGDANKIAEYFPANSFDVVYGSQVLEHLYDPESSLSQWIDLTKPSGYIIATVPDVGSYERFVYPSKNNPDHKVSFSQLYTSSPFPVHCHLPTFLKKFEDRAEILLNRYVERNFDWSLPASVDQTWEESNSCEIWNEVVLRKKYDYSGHSCSR